MLSELSYEQFIALAQIQEEVAVFQEFPGEHLTPIVALTALEDMFEDGILLESVGEGNNARYSHIGLTPIAKFQIYPGESVKEPPLERLRQFYQKFQLTCQHSLCGFMGGIAGIVNYQAFSLFEPVPLHQNTDPHIPLISFIAYQDNITFDHQHLKVMLTTRVKITSDLLDCYQQARQRLKNMIDRLQHACIIAELQQFPFENDRDENTLNGSIQNHSSDQELRLNFESDHSDEAFEQLVEKAKDHIINGDIFQVVLSRTFYRRYHCNPISVYRALRKINPSPYSFYSHFTCSGLSSSAAKKKMIILGASPEKCVSVRKNIIEIKPLAGTRGRTKDDDQRLMQELLNDPKEIAEHMMLVDLARNDIGRVANISSVTVSDLLSIVCSSEVMHLMSTVQGQLSPKYDALSALFSGFPAGTLSGAPKIRAMQIIQSLETSSRDFYGGAICFYDHQGDLETCIAIRMAVLSNGIASVRAGAGIVADSDPAQEARETRQKAQAVLRAILMAEEL